MKKHTTWQDYYQVKYLLLDYYTVDYSVNAILILPPGCPILATDFADSLGDYREFLIFTRTKISNHVRQLYIS